MGTSVLIIESKSRRNDKKVPNIITGSIILLKDKPIPLNMLNSEFLDNLSKVKIEPNKIPTGKAFAKTFGISSTNFIQASMIVISPANTFLIILNKVSGAIHTIIKRIIQTNVAPKTWLRINLSSKLILKFLIFKIASFNCIIL